jgi:hypothetical protein
MSFAGKKYERGRVKGVNVREIGRKGKGKRGKEKYRIN